MLDHDEDENKALIYFLDKNNLKVTRIFENLTVVAIKMLPLAKFFGIHI